MVLLFSTLNKYDFRKALSSIEINLYYLLFSILLVFLNWGLEAKKWQILLRQNTSISFIEAFRSVLVGLALGIITPLMSGDYAGRILTLPILHKKAAVGANLAGSFVQSLVAILFGTSAFAAYSFYFSAKNLSLNILILFALVAACCGGVLLLIYAKKLIQKVPELLKPWLDGISTLSGSLISKVFVLAILRNLVFTLQFLALCFSFQITGDPVLLIIGTGLLFLIKTIGGGLNIFGDLSIRALFSIYFFTQFGISGDLITLVVFLLWLINIAVPAIFGSFFILFFKTKPDVALPDL